jgi:cell division protein FtsX
VRAVVTVVVLLLVGCGSAREGAPLGCIVHVYFCTDRTCATAATRGQIGRLETQLRARHDVYSVVFVSKKQALEIMRKRHPVLVQQLPFNPFPDALRVRPVKGTSPVLLASTIAAGQAGVERVKAVRLARCSA